MEKQKIATKLTLAEMGLTKEVIQKILEGKPEGHEVVVAVIFGRTGKYVAKASKLDPTRDDIAFSGEFEGRNLLDGTIHNAPKAYLPGAAEMATRAAVDSLGDSGELVEFGCEIAVKKKASAAVGYVFGVAVPKQPQAQDNLAALRATMLEGKTEAPAAQIEAPKKDGKKA